jgi:putative transcription factor
MNMNGGQDWDTVVIRKKKPTSASLKDESAVNAARRAGVGVETVKKSERGGPVQTSSGKAAHKLDAETEDFHHEKVSTELKKQIIQARTAKKLTQAQLAQLINEKPQIIQDYESGKAIPNPQVLSKLSRVLGTTLRKNSTK